MYLTENKLKYFIEENLSDDWVCNKQFKKGIPFRPDFRSDKLKLIIEFNGYKHYNCSKTIISDYKKYEIFKKHEYKIIEIPYFVQLSNLLIFNLFNVNIKIKQIYPNGFIDNKALLPSDFCYLGIKRFENDLKTFHFIKYDIIKSIKKKLNEMNKNESLLILYILFYFLNY